MLQSTGSQRVGDDRVTDNNKGKCKLTATEKIPLGCAEPNTGRKGKRGGICIRFYEYQEEMLESYEAFLLLKQNETVGRLLKAD